MNVDPHAAPEGQRPLHVVLYRFGGGILALGFAISLAIYFLSSDNMLDPGRQVANGTMYQHDVRLIGGKAALYATQFNDWFAELWHGRQLACTIAVISVVVAALFFLIGVVVSEPSQSESDDRSS